MKSATFEILLTVCALLFSPTAHPLAQSISPTSSQDAPLIMEISVDAKGCYGSCPRYQVTLRRSLEDSATYVGKKSVERIGNYKGKLHDATFNLLAKYIERQGFFEFRDEFQKGVIDAEVVSISVVRGGKSKTVTTYAMGHEPLELWGIQKAIEGVIAGIKWEKAAVE